MRVLKLSILSTIILSTTLLSDTTTSSDNLANRDTTINIYGVGARVNTDHSSHEGAGIMFDSEAVKIKLEGTGDFFKTGAVLKFNPFIKNWYFKAGANYLNQKMIASDSSSAKVDQYSASLATGYMMMDSLYVEIGAAATKLDGKRLDSSYKVSDETTRLGYIEAAKRWQSNFATIDTTLNASKVKYEYKADENSYGASVDIYPSDKTKLGYIHQYEKGNVMNKYRAQYALLFVEYANNISLHTYQANLGIKVAFDDLFDISTWKIPSHIKPHLSELHRFEEITFGSNMRIQSSNGVEAVPAI
ncbi:hypothetical protein [Sulfurimonas sp. HSL3-2]|uniref:hypothetical protein n=1 Tax=Hydrocurvibacter mobilis TaxID=3131936 RepID=UPI0031F77971